MNPHKTTITALREYTGGITLAVFEPVEIDYSLSVSQTLDRGEFEWGGNKMDRQTIEENLKLEGKGLVTARPAILRFGVDLPTRKIIETISVLAAAAESAGEPVWRAAGIGGGCAFAAEYRNEQRRSPIACLASAIGHPANCLTPVLDGAALV